MERITITLERTDAPRGIIDLAHDAHVLKREVPKITWTDPKTGTDYVMGDWFEIVKVETMIDKPA